MSIVGMYVVLLLCILLLSLYIHIQINKHRLAVSEQDFFEILSDIR